LRPAVCNLLFEGIATPLIPTQVECSYNFYTHTRFVFSLNKTQLLNPYITLEDYVGKRFKLTISDFRGGSGMSPGASEHEGIVTGVRSTKLVDERSFELEGHSTSYLMGETIRTRFFNDCSLEELINQIFSDYSLYIKCTSLLKELAKFQVASCLQYQESDWRFLLKLADKLGLLVIARGDTVVVAAGKEFNGIKPDQGVLSWSQDNQITLLDMNYSLTGTKVNVRAYQYTPDEKLSSKADSRVDPMHWVYEDKNAAPTDDAISSMNNHSETALPIESEIEDSLYSNSLSSFQSAALRHRRSRMSNLFAGHAQSEILDADIASFFSLQFGDDQRFIGVDSRSAYMITSINHSFSMKKYTNSFSFALSDYPPLLSHDSREQRPKWSFTNAIVESNSDKGYMNRARVRLLPNNEPDASVSPEVRQLQVIAGVNHSSTWRPQKDEEILLAISDNPLTLPIILGSLTNSSNRALKSDFPKYMKMEQERLEGGNIGYLRTKAGNVFALSDDEASSEIWLGNQGAYLKIGDGESIVLCVKKKGDPEKNVATIVIDGKGAISIDAGDVCKISSEKDLTLESKSGNIQMGAKGTVKVHAGGEIELKTGDKINFRK